MKALWRVTFIAAIVFAFTASGTFAQGGGGTFLKGEKVAQAGIGFGFGYGTGSTSLPPISIGFQYGVENKISVGGILGYTTSSEDFGFLGNGYSWKYSYFLIGARGEYHFLEDQPNMDAYGGVTLGYYFLSVSSTGFGGTYSGSAGNSGLFGVHVGLRYYFSPQWAAYGELGYGVGIINIGAAYKF